MFIGGKLQYAVIDTAAGSTVALVAASGTKTVRVYAVYLTLAAGTITFKQGSTALTGAMTLTSLALDPLEMASGEWVPHFIGASGAAINMTFSGTNQCSGYAIYTQE